MFNRQAVSIPRRWRIAALFRLIRGHRSAVAWGSSARCSDVYARSAANFAATESRS